MKIVEKYSSEKFYDDNDCRSKLEIHVDGKREFKFLDGEPEDANLGRDYSDCYNITAFFEKIYEHTRNGGVIEFTIKSCDSLEDFED